ncbi:AraC family transcriptional regulator [Paenibacillus sambharensis]|uniref:AraC family transcriptional regulator n=1 Tax=Paenibacillus sambharensis TaxID=1803190 RepID=UPI001FE6B574|nr:AraC family transcriptional regulator [Paenibacillus sambharensis]
MSKIISPASPYGVYGFRFSGGAGASLYELFAVGHQSIAPADSYSWDGLEREDGPLLLLQYTVSGAGEIEVEGRRSSVPAGHAFLVEIPGQHRYYYPRGGSEPWVFYFALFRPYGLLTHWEDIKRRCGDVAAFDPAGSVPALLEHLYREARQHRISDAYRASAHVYQLVMELLHASSEDHTAGESASGKITQAAEWIRLHYDQIKSIDEVAEQAGLSKYHFIRSFTRTVGCTPNHYLTRVRLERAITLLRETELRVEDVAQAVGYTSGSYFIKVFHKWVGYPPGEYRSGRRHQSFSHLFFQ